MTTTEDFLRDSLGSKYPAVKFTAVGQKIVGTIVEDPRLVDGTDLNGEPRTSLVLAIKADTKSTCVSGRSGEEAPVTPGETYSLWIAKGTNMARATAEAVGAEKLTEGGTFAMEFYELGEQKKAGFNRPKLHRAAYKPPAPPAIGADDLI